MTRPNSRSPAPTSLIAAIVAKNAAAAVDVKAATEQYWLVVDKLARGDETGGIDPSSFEAILATLGFTLEQVREDVATVVRIRQTRADLDAVVAVRAEAEAACAIADAKARASQDEADRDKGEAERARWRASEATEGEAGLRLVIRDELRPIEADLRARGFAGELLAPPPPPPPKRRWRMLDVGNPKGVYLQAGSEIDYPGDYLPDPRFFACVGDVTDDMGPPQVVPVPIIPEAQRPGERAEALSAVGPIEMEV